MFVAVTADQITSLGTRLSVSTLKKRKEKRNIDRDIEIYIINNNLEDDDNGQLRSFVAFLTSFSFQDLQILGRVKKKKKKRLWLI